MTITEFLLARIADDEAEATAAHWARCGSMGWDDSTPCDCGLPERTLAECEAKRRIVADRVRIDRSANEDEWSMGYSDANHDALRALAAVYADHPDYNPAWSTT